MSNRHFLAVYVSDKDLSLRESAGEDHEKREAKAETVTVAGDLAIIPAYRHLWSILKYRTPG